MRGKQTLDTMRVAATPFMFDTVDAGFDRGAWDGPIRYVQEELPAGRDGKGYLLIDFGEDAARHRWLPAGHLLEVVVRFWRDFFADTCRSPQSRRADITSIDSEREF